MIAFCITLCCILYTLVSPSVFTHQPPLQPKKTVIRAEACRMSSVNFCVRGWSKCNYQQNKSWLHFNIHIIPWFQDLEMFERKFLADLKPDDQQYDIILNAIWASVLIITRLGGNQHPVYTDYNWKTWAIRR